jgi:predicted nucleotidyltransferase
MRFLFTGNLMDFCYFTKHNEKYSPMLNTKKSELTSAEIFKFLESHSMELKALKVKRLGLFGSFVRGEQQPDSDIDFIVEYEEGGKSFDNFMKLVDFLENAFGYQVELVTPQSLSTYIKPYIDKEVKYVKV